MDKLVNISLDSPVKHALFDLLSILPLLLSGMVQLKSQACGICVAFLPQGKSWKPTVHTSLKII